jgi:valyl-tRNA synthetase
MDKAYDHNKFEKEIYKMWEKSGAFKPHMKSEKKSFTIIMPPPNANGELHLGHATFVAVSDALIRFWRMRGSPTLWLPGVDHAGILTQVTFEKKLKKEEGKTRHDLGRDEFHRRCYEFCLNNKGLMEGQLRSLGASCDWSREKFTLDSEISKLVYETFVHMYNEGLVYRGYRIVNWCPRCRSTLADVELEWEKRRDPLYFMKYGPFTLATVRPETKFGDTAVAVNPKDKRYKKWVGKEVEVEGLLGKFRLKVITDEAVDPQFGTGVVKVTPAHDPIDWDMGQRHHLEVKSVIDFDGRLNELTGPYKGLKVDEARRKVVEDLKARGLIEKVDENYMHEVATCERCGTMIEPLVSRQWFIKIQPLAQKAIQVTREGKVKIIPKKYEAMYFNWMRQIKDWPISRQLWWGHRLPVWYAQSAQKTEEQKLEFDKLKNGDTRAQTDILESPIVSVNKPSGSDEYLQDPDTFDTWFSSGQWPVNTLKTSGNGDFGIFYPTSVMNTAYEILFLWVARMIMFGLYLTGEVPFKVALINGVLRDETGRKMSKSLNNGVSPDEAIAKYGADAIRMGLVSGRDNGNDLLISKQQMEERIRGYRNLANKIWNATRFVMTSAGEMESSKARDKNEAFNKKLDGIILEITEMMEKYRLGQAAELLYNEFWHWYCDECIEKTKKGELSESDLFHGLITFLKLLHPFMPFVTEAVWQELRKEPKMGMWSKMLITAEWPEPVHVPV